LIADPAAAAFVADDDGVLARDAIADWLEQLELSGFVQSTRCQAQEGISQV
jgi:hypothetical protein